MNETTKFNVAVDFTPNHVGHRFDAIVVTSDINDRDVIDVTAEVIKVKKDTTNPNSFRQQILKMLLTLGAPSTAGQIMNALKAEGIDFKWIHSHLNYFKKHNQLIHEGGLYSLTQATYERLTA